MLGAVALTTAMALGAWAPGNAQANTVVSDIQEVVCSAPDMACSPEEPICTENNETCLSSDLNYICVNGSCVTGVGENVNTAVETAERSADDAVAAVRDFQSGVSREVAEALSPTEPVIAYVRTTAEATIQQTLAEAQRIIDAGVCVAPFDPEQPICVSP